MLKDITQMVTSQTSCCYIFLLAYKGVIELLLLLLLGPTLLDM